MNDAFLTKYSPDGDIIWTRLLGTGRFDRAYGVTTTPDGSIYITGYTGGDLDGQTNEGVDDAFLTKYSPDGDIIWTRLLGSSVKDLGYGVATSYDGNIYITGHTNGNLDSKTNEGVMIFFLTKYNPNGTKEWTQFLNSPFDEYGFGIATSADGFIYITGIYLW